MCCPPSPFSNSCKLLLKLNFSALLINYYGDSPRKESRAKSKVQPRPIYNSRRQTRPPLELFGYKVAFSWEACFSLLDERPRKETLKRETERVCVCVYVACLVEVLLLASLGRRKGTRGTWGWKNRGFIRILKNQQKSCISNRTLANTNRIF